MVLYCTVWYFTVQLCCCTSQHAVNLRNQYVSKIEKSIYKNNNVFFNKSGEICFCFKCKII